MIYHPCVEQPLRFVRTGKSLRKYNSTKHCSNHFFFCKVSINWIIYILLNCSTSWLKCAKRKSWKNIAKFYWKIIILDSYMLYFLLLDCQLSCWKHDLYPRARQTQKYYWRKQAVPRFISHLIIIGSCFEIWHYEQQFLKHYTRITSFSLWGDPTSNNSSGLAPIEPILL